MRRLSPNRALRNFEGQILRSGALVEEAALWPDSHYPLVPLLIEFAGTDGLAANGKPARGHNRARDIRILWRFDRERGAWDEVARITSEGSHWSADLAPIVERELALPDMYAPRDDVEDAREEVGRLAALIDGALDGVDRRGQETRACVSFRRGRRALRGNHARSGGRVRAAVCASGVGAPKARSRGLKTHSRRAPGLRRISAASAFAFSLDLSSSSPCGLAVR